MLESLLTSKRGPRYYIGRAPIAKFAVPGRAFGSLGKYGNKLLITSSIGDSDDPYPKYADLLTLSDDKKSLTDTARVTPWDGTVSNGCTINGKLWYHIGYDNGFRNYICCRDISTGVLEFTSTPYEDVGTVRQVVEAIDSDNILVALGESIHGESRAVRIFNIPTKTWSYLPDLTTEFIYSYFGGVTNKVDGKIYLGYTVTDQLGWFDKTTKTFGYTQSFTHLLQSTTNERRLIDTGVCSYGRYILLFGRGLRESTDAIMSAVRYDVLAERFDVFDFPMLTPRYLSPITVHEDEGLIHVHSGSVYDNSYPGLDWESTEKHGSALVFDATQFLR